MAPRSSATRVLLDPGILRQGRWVQIQGLADLLRKSLVYNFERAKAQLHELATKLGRLPKLKDFYDEKGVHKGYRWVLKGIRQKEWVLLYRVSNFSELIDKTFGISEGEKKV
ncbi:MAG: hypothetical protein ACFFC7_01975 [Candidatus Hermodarchaeota archaeon]